MIPFWAADTLPHMSKEVTFADAQRVTQQHEDDAELVAQLKQGCTTAAGTLFDRYGLQIHRLVRRTLGPDAEHDDVVQQIFVNVFGNIEKLRDPAALRSWVFALALNTLRQELRKRYMRRRFFGDDEIREDTLAGPAEDHGARQALRRTYDVLDRLKPDERVVFVLHYFAEQTQQQIAQTCSCSVPTVKRRLKRARQRFEKLVQRDPVLAERLSGKPSAGGGT